MFDGIKFGVQLPCDNTDFMGRSEIDEWLDAVGGSNFGHVMLGDHVLGVDSSRLEPEVRENWERRWPGPDAKAVYTYRDTFREPFVLFGYLAARCDLELATGVLVLPQRQTGLVAKQAAEVDLLSGGRLRLAVSAGWSSIEFEALGAPFAERGRLMDEQIELLRLFWTQDVVDYRGEFHTIVHSGIQTLPLQRPIPLWFGGDAKRSLERIGRTGDGWHPPGTVLPDQGASDRRSTIFNAALAAGRDPASIGIEPRLYMAQWTDEEMLDFVRSWRRLGATHVCIDTRTAGQKVPLAEHIRRVRKAAQLFALI